MTAEIAPADFPGLESLCWNRSKTAPIDRETAWSLYRANWRFFYRDDLTAEETHLIESLEVEFGAGERLLGTKGPPPPFALTTPEQAAEILDTDLVLLEQRVRAGVLACRDVDGRMKFVLPEVLELKKKEDAVNAAMLEASQLMEGLEPPRPNGLRNKP